MPTLAEILAAKKTGSTPAPAVTPAPTPAPPTDAASNHIEDHIKSVEIAAGIKTIAEPTKEEPATAPVPKAMTFAERMAQKRAEASSHSTSVAPVVSTPVASVEATSPKPSATTAPAPVVAQSPVQVAPTLVPADTTTTSTAAVLSQPDEISVEARQAYADIKEKIDTLNTMSGDDLKGAMSTLKKSLMANPAAVSLMEDTDIGQMVIALRKLTGEDIAEAGKEKAPGRKKKDKQIDLSDAAVVAAVFDEL